MISVSDYYDKGMDMSDLENGEPSNNRFTPSVCRVCEASLTDNEAKYGDLCDGCKDDQETEREG